MCLCAKLAKFDGLFFQERFLQIFLAFFAVYRVLALFEQAGAEKGCARLVGEHLVSLDLWQRHELLFGQVLLLRHLRYYGRTITAFVFHRNVDTAHFPDRLRRWGFG